MVAVGTPATRERDWLEWLSANVPIAGLGLLVPIGARMVVVAPHPDDEVLGVGGVVAAAAAAHRRLLFIAISRGTASHPGSRVWTTDRLAVARERETLAGLRSLGLDAPKIIRCGFQDGKLASSERALVLLLRRLLKPTDVVFTTWSEDGHPDHDVVGRAATQAVTATGGALVEFPVWTWNWAVPGDSRVPWHRAVQFQLLPAILARKRASIAAHRSQLVPDPSTDRPAVLSAATLERFARPFEVFLR